MVVTLKKYILINNINNEILNLISQLIDKVTDLTYKNINEDASLKKIILELKIKFLGFFRDLVNSLDQYNIWRYFIIFNYISVGSNLLIQGKLDDLCPNEFMDEFLDLSFIFESNNSFYKNLNILFKELPKFYEDFLIKLLKYSAKIIQAKSLKNIEEQNNTNINGKKNKSKIKNVGVKQKEENIEKIINI